MSSASLLITFLHCIIAVYSNHIQNLLVRENNFEPFQNCIDDIAATYFAPNELVVIFNSPPSPLRTVHLKSNPALLLNGLNKTTNWNFQKVDAYIILATAAEKLAAVLDFLAGDGESWNPRAKFLIVIEENFAEEEVWKVLLDRYVVNVLVMTGETSVFTYFPYTSSKLLEPVLIHTCGRDNFVRNLFPDKLPKSWNETVLETAAVEFSPYVVLAGARGSSKTGIEIMIFDLIRDVLKFKVNYSKRRYDGWGTFSNGSYDEAYGDLRKNRAHLGIGFFRASHPENLRFDQSFIYMEDNLKWVVPVGKRLNHFQSILMAFKLEVWGLLLALMVLVPCVFYGAAKIVVSQDGKYFKTYLASFMVCLKCILCQAVSPQPTSTLLRLLFAMWCIFSWVIVTAFQSNLVTYLNIYQYEKSINNIDELIRSGIKIGVVEELRDLYANFANEPEEYLHTHLEVCDSTYACLNRTAFGRDFATIKSKRFAERAARYVDPFDDRLMLRFFDQNVQNVYVNWVFVKGHPIVDSVNRLLLHAKAAGFVERCYSHVDNLGNLFTAKGGRVLHATDGITLEELEGVFTLLLFGYALGIVCFLAELAVSRYFRQKYQFSN